MVTDNSNFCRFRVNSFLLSFPLGEDKYNYFLCSRGSNHSMLFLWQLKLPGMLAYLQTTGYLPYWTVSSLFESVVIWVPPLPHSSDDEWSANALKDLYLQDCKTLYITWKANKTQTRYRLQQELHRRVHRSHYFKAHTLQTEQIKLCPEGGTSMKCLKTAAVFILIVYRLASIN